jgi:enoyl-[acyl-carrier-protein] reductase (NADH)
MSESRRLHASSGFRRRSPRTHRSLRGSGANHACCRRIDVGGTSLWLLSDLSKGVTGQNVYVDSGYSIMGL